MQTFLLNIVKDGQLNLNMEDPIVTGSLIAKDGEIVHTRVKEVLQAKGGARG